jgi:hypothetical protein
MKNADLSPIDFHLQWGSEYSAPQRPDAGQSHELSRWSDLEYLLTSSSGIVPGQDWKMPSLTAVAARCLSMVTVN